jgi:hypothetical protein
MRRLDAQEIAWQVDVIRQTSAFCGYVGRPGPDNSQTLPTTVANRKSLLRRPIGSSERLRVVQFGASPVLRGSVWAGSPTPMSPSSRS